LIKNAVSNETCGKKLDNSGLIDKITSTQTPNMYYLCRGNVGPMGHFDKLKPEKTAPSCDYFFLIVTLWNQHPG